MMPCNHNGVPSATGSKARKFPKMKTPPFRHGNGRSIMTPKFHRSRYGSLVYFAGITKPTPVLPDYIR